MALIQCCEIVSTRLMPRCIFCESLRSRATGVWGHAPSSSSLSLDMSSLTSTQVNLPTTAGDMGILANHVPTIQQLRPGIIEIIDGAGAKQFFVSGGFATVTEGSSLAINAGEAFPVEDLSGEAVRRLTTEAQKNASSSDEAVALEAKIELEVLEALSAVAK
jgi:F-type H+-transporting ATPase subunit delta